MNFDVTEKGEEKSQDFVYFFIMQPPERPFQEEYIGWLTMKARLKAP